MKQSLLLALLAVAPVVSAQTQMVGQVAPEFAASVCVNQPDAISLEQCAGEVVLIKYWGTK